MRQNSKVIHQYFRTRKNYAYFVRDNPILAIDILQLVIMAAEPGSLIAFMFDLDLGSKPGI